LRPGRLSSGLGRTGALLAALLVLPIYALEMIVHWAELSRQRRALGMLDDRLLRDIGVSRADIEAETSKRFWYP
jgi:uncharacterized protein YjiS (DUF1127 family)